MATYTDELRRAVHIAQKHCKEYSSELFTPAHLLMGLLHNDVGLASWLAVQGKDIHYLRDWAEIRMEESPRAGRTPENPPGNAQVKATMELADLIALQLGREPTDPLSVLGALLKPGVGFSAEQLRSFPLTQKELLDAALDDTATQEALQGPPPGADGQAAGDTAPKSAGALLKFCHDKTALAAEGRMDPIIGRDREIRMMVEVLSRRTKPNVILVGEPGVGKTALVDGFALNIVAGKVPSNLLGARLFELDTGALAAGASYKGEVEDRVKNILRELKQFEKAILFIDEIHVLLDSRGALGGGIVNLLKPELARGELTVIGATTNDEYRKYIETDEAFGRRFEVLNVPEPDVTTAIRMLKHLLPLYEKHHQLRIEDDVLSEAVRLSKRYVKDRRLPDVAVDLLDRTLAATRLMRETSAPEVEALRLRLEAVLAETPPDLLLPELRWFDTELRHRISPLLLSQLEDTDWVAEDIDVAEVLRQHLEQKLTDLARCAQIPKEAVTKHDIAAVISHKTGIPLGKIQSKERDKLLLVEEVLRQRVIGQNHAVKALSDSILESRAGLTKAGQPVGSFFLLGSTGTGKTELAKALADFLFNDEAFLIRFDMSE
ncbi:MAG: ATP-dependent Clp protease ATP-binding subunit, partial [Sphingobacteriaceae bacterium]|nr:ATP-dependent Clp protease ATP-binding subunit [Cytophagaceae bacterium]